MEGLSRAQKKEANLAYKKGLKQALKHSKFPYFQFILVTILNSLFFGVLSMWLLGLAGNIAGGEIFDNSKIVLLIVLTVVVSVISLPIRIFQDFITLKYTYNSQAASWSKFIRLPLNAFDKLNPSALISTVMNDSVFTGNYVAHFINSVVSIASLPMIIAIAMMGSGVKLTMVQLPIIVLMLMIILVFRNAAVRLQRNVQRGLSKLTRYLSEKLGSIKDIKADVMEDQEYESGCEYIDFEYSQKKALLGFNTIFINALTEMFKNTGIVIAIVVGSQMVIKGTMDKSTMMVAYMQSAQLPVIIYSAVVFYLQLRQYKGGFSRIGEMYQIKSEVADQGDDMVDMKEAYSFENVSFSYDGFENAVDNASFQIPKGKVTAIVGASGSGKSTVLKLLERFYQPDSGTIKLDGQDAEEISLDAWRRAFGYVVQKNLLFMGSIRDNITYGMDEVSDDQVKEALKQANILEFVESLPEGLNTELGEFAENVSSGQKQRIAIARALVRKPSCLLLDEAGANLDKINEKEINDTFFKVIDSEKTAVIVAHNLLTISRADNIILMDKGKVVAQGTHTELVDECVLYKKYWELNLN